MSVAKRQATNHATPAREEEASARSFLKVYCPPREKADFAEEARTHGQDASAYARFILNARKDPILFLQLCRLRDPAFAAGLAGNPTDVGRAAELEKRVLELTHERDDAVRERDDAERRAVELEQKVGEAVERQQSLAAYVVDLAKVDRANRERAVDGGQEYEAVPRQALLIVKALSVSPGLRRKELEERLVAEGLSAGEASEAVTAAMRLDLIVKGRDMRFRLAKQPDPEGEEE